MEWLTKIFSWLSLRPLIIGGVAVVSGTMLLFPAIPIRLGFAVLIQPYLGYIGMLFFVSLIFTLIHISFRTIPFVWGFYRTMKRQEYAIERLDDSEKAILREFWVQQSNTITLDVSDSSVAHLLRNGILENVSGTSETNMYHLRISAKFMFLITNEMLEIPRVYCKRDEARVQQSRPFGALQHGYWIQSEVERKFPKQ